jgi:hypothetical protein
VTTDCDADIEAHQVHRLERIVAALTIGISATLVVRHCLTCVTIPNVNPRRDVASSMGSCGHATRESHLLPRVADGGWTVVY